jgi:DUF4097 and DUF4098 domain-containing protein YvlB
MKIPTIALVSLLLSAGAASAQQAIDRTMPASATGTVTVNNVAGRVKVVAWNRPEIRVTGTLGRGAERLDVTGGGDNTEIRVVVPRNTRDLQGTDLEVHVPVRKSVSVQTVSADIEVGGVTGAVNARSTSGDVEVSGNTAATEVHTVSGNARVSGSAREKITAETVSGEVTVEAPTQDLAVKSVSGDLRIRGGARRASVSTVSGSADVQGGTLQYGSFQSVSGDLHYEGALASDAAVEMQSHSGDVEIALPANVRARFQVSTFSGDIDNGLGSAEAQRTSRYTPGRELSFSTGEGGLVTVKTFSGSVKLERR